MFPHGTTLEFAYESPTRARIVASSVAYEVGEIDDDRSRTTLERDGEVLTLEIGARDVTALRAALNTWLTLVDVAETTAALADAHATRR